jgi:D-xylonolactonase
VHLWNPSSGARTFLTQHDGETLFLNDILADSAGRVYAGTCYWGASGMEKLGKLYLIDNTGRAKVVADGIELANGLGFSPGDRQLYFADSTVRRIYQYDVDPKTGDLSRKRIFVQIPLDEGIPDGLTVDRDGFVWSAQVYGSQVVRYDPDGKVERRVAIPAKQVTSVIFGGKDYTDLYVTTAAEPWPGPLTPPGYDAASGNVGGSLYRVRIDDAQGRPEYVVRIKP